MRELRKKIVPAVFLVLLLFAGIVALTQEADEFDPAPEPSVQVKEKIINDFQRNYELAQESPEWVMPVRWFRSNAGGMALEEIPSRYAALRNKYALSIDFISPEELPEYLFSYYDGRYFIEIRKLYEHGEEVRIQWIFRDKDGVTRLIAVFVETEDDEVINYVENENDNDIVESEDDSIESAAPESGNGDEGNNGEEIAEEIKEDNSEKSKRNGFIEIFDENAFITSEYRFFNDREISRTDYNYKDGYVISANAFVWEKNEERGEFTETHADFFRYNRSSFLRAVERVFYKDRQISPSDNIVKITFPGNILDAARNDYFMSEKLNPYPEFFGDTYVSEDSRIVFAADERGRVLTQTLHDSEDKIIWVIRNTWSGDRIVSVSKTEGDTEYLAEYEYDADGNRVLERNLRNGILERLVMTEDNKDIEQLYLNNVVILQAVWEDGRKISETRMR